MSLSFVCHFRSTYRFSVRNFSDFVKTITMDWEPIKSKFINMKIDEKRSFYKCGSNFKTVDDLITWHQYYRTKTPLAAKIDILGGFEIDNTKNEELAKKICIFKGDITALEVDAIVNAANQTLLGGGGVDGAIHNHAGPELKEECRTLKGCPTGEAKMTGAYRLPSKYVIHTVGPRGEKPDLLSACYKNCLNHVLQSNIKTVAFPCISTGIYGYPLDKAAQVACRQVRSFLEKNSKDINLIIFVLFEQKDVNVYEGTLQSFFPVS